MTMRFMKRREQDELLEQVASRLEVMYGGGSSDVWNKSFAQAVRDMKSTGRSPL